MQRRRERKGLQQIIDCLGCGGRKGLQGMIEPQRRRERRVNEMRDLIRESRELLQNQYAYLDGNGGFSAVEPSAQTERRKRRNTDHKIEDAAKSIQIQLWKQRKSIWADKTDLQPEDILDPITALRWLDYDCDYDESLGRFKVKAKSIEVAGIMDGANKRVRISREFPVNIRNFTAAHELGHIVLEHEGIGLHRDKPLDGSNKDVSRPAQETEADKFATYFLMPEKLVRKAFNRLFGTECFALTEATMFALLGRDFMQLEARCKNRRDLARILASAERYNGIRFVSLANQFHVSKEAMAIRLEELDLVDSDH